MAMKARTERTEVDQDWVVERLVENANRAMQAVPVIDRDGNETGKFTYAGSVANRALELLGKHAGMFKEGPPVAVVGSLTYNVDYGTGE